GWWRSPRSSPRRRGGFCPPAMQRTSRSAAASSTSILEVEERHRSDLSLRRHIPRTDAFILRSRRDRSESQTLGEGWTCFVGALERGASVPLIEASHLAVPRDGWRPPPLCNCLSSSARGWMCALQHREVGP